MTGKVGAEPHQVLEECSHLPREHSQVQEARGQLVAVLGQVTIAQGLHCLSVLLLVLHMACADGRGLRVCSSLGPGYQANSLTEARAVDRPHSLLDSLQDGLVSFQDLEMNVDRGSACQAGWDPQLHDPTPRGHTKSCCPLNSTPPASYTPHQTFSTGPHRSHRPATPRRPRTFSLSPKTQVGDAKLTKQLHEVRE